MRGTFVGLLWQGGTASVAVAFWCNARHGAKARTLRMLANAECSQFQFFKKEGETRHCKESASSAKRGQESPEH